MTSTVTSTPFPHLQPGRSWATTRRAYDDAAVLGARAGYPSVPPPGMPPGYESEASAAWDNVLSSVHMGESGSMTGTRESTRDVGEVAGSTVRGGANVRSPVQTLAVIGASELGGGGGGGRGLGGDGVGSEYEGHDSGLSTVFSILLAAKFGAALQPERSSAGRAGSPTRAALSSPTHSAPPSPPQSPATDGGSLGGKPSRRFCLSRQNTRTCPSSEASSTVAGGSPGVTPPGPKSPELVRQRTRGAKLAAATSAAATSAKAAAAKAAPTHYLSRKSTHPAFDEQNVATHKRFGLSRQRTISSKAGLTPEQVVEAQAELPC